MTAFDRLSGALTHQIVHALGWRDLRPVQQLTIDAILDGDNAVVLAPTAGGKTEAAFFPLLSMMDVEDWQPVSTLYLSPIRALLNNQEDRVARYAGMIGRRAFKWHGDTAQSQRKRFLRDPSDILLTTPESLEAMLMSPRIPARTLFAGLRAVVIDEVHAFADDDRGAHLSALLERLSRFCGRDLQRIGLSATVGNPEEILKWLRGRSQREGRVVSPPKPKSDAQLSLDYVGSMENAALVVAKLHPGRKRLVFVDSRRGVEQLGHLLNDRGVLSYVAHGSLSAAARKDAERAFAEGSDCVIAATSALELGIDVGDLDHVLQVDSPPSVASFLQRMGRTGRRPGAVTNCTFLAAKETALLQAAGIIRLFQRGFVEDVRPSRRAAHILAHQIMALGIQESGIGPGDWWAWLQGATAFDALEAPARAKLVEHMLTEEILADQDGRLWLGPKGEKLFGRRNFAELYAVFSTPRVITVLWDAREVGTIDAQFLQGVDTDDQRAAFVLGGRAWRVIHVDWNRGKCSVKPAEHARAPRWSGAPQYLSYDLCRAMHDVLVGDDDDPVWSHRARETIASLRAEHSFLQDEPAPITEDESGELTWWTYAGGAANLLLARIIEHELGGKCTVRNTSLTCKDEAGQSRAALLELIRTLAAEGRPNADDARRFAQGEGRSRISKFEPCLPEELLLDLLAEQTLDVEGAVRAVGMRAGGGAAADPTSTHRARS